MGVNTMKKRFEIAVAFIMVVVLCLALTGCGQNTSKPATSNNDVTQPDVSGGENHENDTTATQEPTAPPASIDNKNPQQDANGMWIFEVRGHEVKLRTNIWDYIGRGETKNLFWNQVLSKDLGYEEPYNADGLYMRKNSDGTLVYVGFQHHTEGSCDVMVGTDRGTVASVRYANFDASQMEYVTDTIKYPVSLEFCILCTYALEYNQDHPGEDPFADILADYRMSDSGSAYRLDYPVK